MKRLTANLEKWFSEPSKLEKALRQNSKGLNDG
jgi:hypothetical protein